MKSFLFSLVAISIVYVGAFAQTNDDSPCPTISVNGQAGIPLPNEPYIFTADLGKESTNFALQYKWTVSGGKIIEGQGTLAVKALQNENGENLTVTLEVIGLPEKCANTASETAPPWCPLESQLIDEFSIDSTRIDKARLDNFLTSLQNNPSAMGYIIEKFDSKTSKNTVKLKNQKIANYLTFRGFDKSRIILLNALADENLTQLFLIPAGASPPTGDDCVIVKF